MKQKDPEMTVYIVTSWEAEAGKLAMFCSQVHVKPA